MKNKYQEALERIGAEKLARGELIRNDSKVEPYLNILQELVDKETPKKPNKLKEFITFDGIVYKIAKCPNCKGNNKVREYVSGNRCYTCGQKLDWSDNNED